MGDEQTTIKQILTNFIKNNFVYSEDSISISDNTSFIDEGIIDSTGILELIDFIEEKFDIIIENDEVIPQNLDSLSNIQQFILKKRSLK